MPRLVFHADLEADYRAQLGTPCVRSVDVDLVQSINFTIPAAGSPDWQHVHIEHIGTLKALVLVSNAALWVRLDGQTSEEFKLVPVDTGNAILALLDVAIDAGPGFNLNVKPVASDLAVAVYGVAAGTAAEEADGVDGYGDGGFGEDGYGS